MSTNSALTIDDVLDRRSLSRLQIYTFLLCGTVLILDGFDAQNIGFLAPSIAMSLHVPINKFGPVFGSALFGLMIAAMLAGPIADRWGRKWPIVFSSLMFGVFTILTARAHSFNELILFRFLTGLGLGGAMPNVVSLTSEYAPKRLLPVFVSMLFCGMPAGGLLGSALGTVMLPRWGWQSVLYVGGILPVIVASALIILLPESLRFLAVSGTSKARLQKLLARIAPDLEHIPIRLSSERAVTRTGIPVVHLFTEGRAFGTLLLWVPYFMNLVIIYFIVSWLPSLILEVQGSRSAGVEAIVFFSLGGIAGSLAEGRLISRFRTVLVLGLEFGITSLLIVCLAFTAAAGSIFLITFILGVTIQGAQAGLNALVAAFYPTDIRSTGVGWALGIGRVGSIIGPTLAGALLSIGWSPRQIFLAGGLPALCAVASIAITARNRTIWEFQ